MANLMKYEDGSFIRTATADETAASLAAAEIDGGAGCITVEIDGEPTTCYVIGETGSFSGMTAAQIAERDDLSDIASLLMGR